MIIIEIFKETITIASFVMIMMLLIEYITVHTHGKWNISIQNSNWLQIILGALLGLVPGCVGGFFAVSLYSHRIINFAALVTVMIAATGDEAFVMFAMIPSTAILLNLIIFGIAVLVGLMLNMFLKNRSLIKLSENHYNIHNHEAECFSFLPSKIISQLKNITFHRALLITGGLFFTLFLVNESINEKALEFEVVVYFIVALIGIFIVATVPDHFLKEHLWEHVVKKHFLRVFLWTLGAFVFIHFITSNLNIESWIKSNHVLTLIIAVLIGIIPQSGPNIIFISLFASGAIPFSILLANSIVQDGHGTLPLLAESRKSFFVLKLINAIIGLLVGITVLWIGY